MHQSIKRFTALFLCGITLTAGIPAAAVSAADFQADVSYEDTDALQQKFADMLDGNVSIYLDEEKTELPEAVKVDTVLDNSQRYYVFNSKGEYIYGKQCYIVAQAFYCTLFDEFVLHADADTKYDHSEKVLGLTEGISYELFFEKKIKPGAYLRTTGSKDGEFDSKNGHSLMILDYDYSTVTILEGNGDANGKVHQWTITYDKFNAYYLARKNRVIAHVVQPTEAYYKQKFGYTSPTEPEQPPIETQYDYQYRSLHRIGMKYQLDKPEDGMTWTSSNPDVVTVDENGVACAVADGSATITGESERYQYTFSVDVSAVSWEQAGDADGDGKTDILDAKRILTYCVSGLIGENDSLSYDQQRRYDANDDGKITITDARYVLVYDVLHSLYGNETPEQIWARVLDVEM